MESLCERHAVNAIDTREQKRKSAGREIRYCDATVRNVIATHDSHKKAHLSAGFFVFDVAAPEGFEPPNA